MADKFKNVPFKYEVGAYLIYTESDTDQQWGVTITGRKVFNEHNWYTGYVTGAPWRTFTNMPEWFLRSIEEMEKLIGEL